MKVEHVATPKEQTLQQRGETASGVLPRADDGDVNDVTFAADLGG